MKVTKRERALLGVMGVVLAGVGIYVSLWPGAGAVGTSLAEQQKKRRGVEAELARVRGEVADLEARVEKKLATGSDRELAREMIQASQEAAKTAGLRLSDLKPIRPEQVAGLRRVPVEITVSTPFPKAVRFLYELQKRDDRFHVETLRMGSGDAHADRLDLELRVVGYVKVEEDEHASRS
jgi:type II secretory pathway component PulM